MKSFRLFVPLFLLALPLLPADDSATPDPGKEKPLIIRASILPDGHIDLSDRRQIRDPELDLRQIFYTTFLHMYVQGMNEQCQALCAYGLTKPMIVLVLYVPEKNPNLISMALKTAKEYEDNIGGVMIGEVRFSLRKTRAEPEANRLIAVTLKELQKRANPKVMRSAR